MMTTVKIGRYVTMPLITALLCVALYINLIFINWNAKTCINNIQLIELTFHTQPYDILAVTTATYSL